MASEKFNTLSGITVGIPPIDVVSQSGNIVSNFNNPNGNVTTNLIFANQYRLANGSPFVGDLNSLSNASTISDTDELIILQNGVPRKVTVESLKTYLGL